MGNVDLEVAQVLDGAADLYESEQVEWCAMNWAREDARPNYDTGKYDKVVSMCAEGALMTASGFTIDQVVDFQRQKANELALAVQNYDAYGKFLGARRSLQMAIGVYVYVTVWNDSHDQDDKQDIIDTMRTVAKDIRNQAPAEVL